MKISKIDNVENFFSYQIEKKEEKNFSDIFIDFIKDVNNDLLSAKEAEKKIAEGNVENIQELLYQISKSDISLRLITEIRNKALESYQEIMRMQV
ncbi:MAG: flagellar hook-basal body complex protein FliE [Aquificae bacterium]|nr:flagellar hook-basal body complex protein FliE [Aquificota bacterium]